MTTPRLGAGEIVGRLVALLFAGGAVAFGVVLIASSLGLPAPVIWLVALAAVGSIAWKLVPRAATASSAAVTTSEGVAVSDATHDGQGPLVGIIMGSRSDMAVMEECTAMLDTLGVPYEVVVASAHRQPEKVHDWASGAADRGLRVIIAAAGKAAHLGGVVAAYTTLPVVAVPMKTSDLGGLDSLLSMVQMPSGVPVACVAINGAKNAAILATQVLGTSMPRYRDAIAAMKAELAEG